jgi:methyl-accepting chemotaxis protein
MPQVLAFEGIVFLAFAAEPGPAMVAGSVLLVASAWYVARRYEAVLGESNPGPPSAPPDLSMDLRTLCALAFPVWSRQLKTSRLSADKAVARLSAIFGEIVEKLEETLVRSLDAVGGGERERSDVLHTLDQSREELTQLVAILKEMEGARDDARRQVRTLAAELNGMAGNVGQMSMRLRIATLNATIEAAHFGSAGKVFATVFGEIRQLARESEEESARMSRRLATMSFSMAGDKKGGSTIAHAEKAVHGVLHRFGDLATRLEASVSHLECEHGKIRDHVADALVALQFQDRVSQIVSHVHAGLDELACQIDAGTEATFDVTAWTARSSQRYSTFEEFANHEGGSAPTERAQEVTFF